MHYLCLQSEYFSPVFPIPTVVCTCKWRFPSFWLFPFWTLKSGIARHFWTVLIRIIDNKLFCAMNSTENYEKPTVKKGQLLYVTKYTPVGVVGSEVAWLRRAASACPWFISLRIEFSSWSAAFVDRAGVLAELDIISAADSTRESPKNRIETCLFCQKGWRQQLSSCATPPSHDELWLWLVIGRRIYVTRATYRV
jgi:hypothetical protein